MVESAPSLPLVNVSDNVLIGETDSAQPPPQPNGGLTNYKDLQFTKRISEELLLQLQKSASLEDGFESINQALEYVRGNRIYQ